MSRFRGGSVNDARPRNPHDRNRRLDSRLLTGIGYLGGIDVLSCVFLPTMLVAAGCPTSSTSASAAFAGTCGTRRIAGSSPRTA